MTALLKGLAVGGLLFLVSIMSAGTALSAGLTDDEVYWLTYMREEEKLARDVYLSLYDTWGIPSFSKISASEQTHMAAIKIRCSPACFAVIEHPASGLCRQPFHNRIREVPGAGLAA